MWRLAESTIIAAVFLAGILLASRLGGSALGCSPDSYQPGPDRIHIHFQEN